MMSQPNYYAFFDVDGTLINTKSMMSFMKYFYKEMFGVVGLIKFYLFSISTHVCEMVGVSRESLNKIYYVKLKGYPVSMIETLGEKWFSNLIANNDIFINATMKEIHHHRLNNGEIVFVSGSFHACLKPLVKHINGGYIIATDLEVENGCYTGEIKNQTVGYGKVIAIRKFLESNHYSYPHNCYAYGDHESDVTMLYLVGHPCVVSGNKVMERHAKENNWRIIKNET